jgi:MATE family multidrug resistance protein
MPNCSLRDPYFYTFLETVLVAFVVFHQYLPKCLWMLMIWRHIVETKEVVEIASNYYLWQHFSNFRRNSGCCFRSPKRFTGCENTNVYYICIYWVVGFPISIYLGLYTDLKATGIWIGLLVGLSFAALFLYLRFSRLNKS